MPAWTPPAFEPVRHSYENYLYSDPLFCLRAQPLFRNELILLQSVKRRSRPAVTDYFFAPGLTDFNRRVGYR